MGESVREPAVVHPAPRRAAYRGGRLTGSRPSPAGEYPDRQFQIQQRSVSLRRQGQSPADARPGKPAARQSARKAGSVLQGSGQRVVQQGGRFYAAWRQNQPAGGD